jgi:Flp pilus assembly pilin Flp
MVTAAFVRLQTMSLRDALKREDGQTVTEYTLVLAFVAILLAGVLLVLRDQIQVFIDTVGGILAGLPGWGP